nr:hypothetical protein [Tanacetum cinerariifolium]
EDASKQGEIAELDANEDVTLEEVDDEITKDADVQGGPVEVEEVIEVVTAIKLMTEVATTATTTFTHALTNTVAPVPKASAPRRRRGMIIQDPEEAATASVIVQSKDEAFARELEAELNANINWNEMVDQVKRKERQDNTVMRNQALKRKIVTKAQAKKNMMHYNSIQAFLEKGENEIEEEGSKRKFESFEQRAAKKQKTNKETEELKADL